jgi:hypothetical protein
VLVIGEDPEFPVRGIDAVLDVRPARRDQHGRRFRIVGGHEADFVGAVLAGADQDVLAVLGLADADGEGDILLLLVQRLVAAGGLAEAVEAGAVAAPILVDLGEDDAAAVGGPDRLADADFRDRLDVLAGGEVADRSLKRSDPSSSTRMAA